MGGRGGFFWFGLVVWVYVVNFVWVKKGFLLGVNFVW